MAPEQRQPRTALVTGGARRIGETIVRFLHQRGLNIALHYRESEAAAQALAAALEQQRAGSVRLVRADLADPGAPARMAQETLDGFGRLDLLVNNASAFYPTVVQDSDPAQWDELMDSNLRGPYFLSRACAPPLARHSGAIVNLVDIHGLIPLKNHGIYSMAKAGLVMQTRSLAKDLAPDIRVNGVAPGTILWPEGVGETSTEAEAVILERVPLGRQGSPEDIAGAVAYLGLDAPYITGQILAVDGGRMLNM